MTWSAWLYSTNRFHQTLAHCGSGLNGLSDHPDRGHRERAASPGALQLRDLPDRATTFSQLALLALPKGWSQ